MIDTSRKKWHIPAVFLFFILLGVAYNTPLIRHFSSAIPYTRFPVPGYEEQRMNMGDHLNLYYNFWLLKDNLTHLRNPFSDPYQFYYWGKKFFNPQIAFFSVLFAIFSTLGNVVAFNLVFILSFMFAGGITFLWLRRTGIAFWPAVAGGTIYCLAPHRLSQMCGHTNGLFYFSFPLLLYFAEGLVGSQKKRYPVLMGIVLLLMAWTEYHMFYYTVLFLVPYGLFVVRRLVTSETGHTPEGQPVVLILLEGAGIGTLMATMAIQRGWPYGDNYLFLIPIFALGFYFLVDGLSAILAGLVQTPETAMNHMSASILLPLILFVLYPVKLWVAIPQYGHLLFAGVVLIILFNIVRFRSEFKWKRADPPAVRRVLNRFLPVLPLALLSGGIVFAIKKFVLGGTIAERGRGIAEIRYFSPHFTDLLKRTNYEGESMLFLGFLALALMALCLGYLIITRKRGTQPRPLISQARFWFGAFLFFTFLSLGLSVPAVPLYAFFYKFIPYFKYPRVPGRIIFISYAAMAFCTAWALDRISLQRTGLKAGLVILVMAGMLWDYFPTRPLGLCMVDRRKAVYATMDKKGMPPKTVLELPVWPGDSAWSTIYQYYVTRYRYPMVNGYSPLVSKDYVDRVFYGLYPMDVGEVSEKSVEMLEKLHVRYVTFHAEAYPYKICPFPPWMVLRRLKALPFLKVVRSSSYKTLFRVVPPVDVEGIDGASLEAIDSPVGVFWEAERSRHLIGKVILDPLASAGKALVSMKWGKRGMMMGNQNRFFPRGRYEGVIRIKTGKASFSNKNETLGTILITGQHRRNTLTRKEITTRDLTPGTYSDLHFSFHVSHAQKIECIVYSNGRAPLCLDYAFIAFKGRGEGDAVFQAEELFHQARILPLPSGEGLGVRFSPDIVNNRGISGPLHRLMTGHYRATFWMAVEDGIPLEKPVVIIQIVRGHQREVLKTQTLKHAAWDCPQKLTPFTLDFSLKRPSIMQFPVYYQGNGVLWVDRIEVAKIAGP